MKLFWIIFFFLCCYPLPPVSAIYLHNQIAGKDLSIANTTDIIAPDYIKNTLYTGFPEDMFSDTRFFCVPEIFREFPYRYQYRQLFKEGIFFYIPYCFNKTTDPLLELDIPPPVSV